MKDIKASNRSNKHKVTENLVNIKKLRAMARETLKSCKRQTWIKYVSSLNSATPLSSIWKTIKSIKVPTTQIAVPAFAKKKTHSLQIRMKSPKPYQ